MRIENLQNENRKFTKSIGNFHVLEYVQDASVSPMNAMNEYFMSKMNVRRKQVVIDIDKDHSAVIQSGSMQWMGGNVQATSGVKGIGDFLGKALKGAVTKETAVKPEYVGEGCLVLEPTYKYIILADIGKWGSAGMTIEDEVLRFTAGTFASSKDLSVTGRGFKSSLIKYLAPILYDADRSQLYLFSDHNDYPPSAPVFRASFLILILPYFLGSVHLLSPSNIASVFFLPDY